MDSKERIARALAISTQTKVFEMGCGVSDVAAEVFNKWFPGRQAAVVADVNTWAVLGEKVYNQLCAAGIPTVKYIIDKKEFHADWKYVEMVDHIVEGDLTGAKAIEEEANHAETDPKLLFKEADSNFNVLVSVGSGVINDLCKLASHHHAQSYICLATAASVDGYSSFGASITYQNAKQTFTCPAPLAIIADLDVLAAAPKEMTAAGYADLAAKVPAGAEWMVADFVGTEPIVPEAWHMLQDNLDLFLNRPAAVAAGDKDAIADLFEGLTLSGIAMQVAGSSRPASCSEHLFSHILDMTHHRYNGKLQSHGFQVAIGTLTMCAVFDELFKLDLTQIDVDKCVEAWPSLEDEQKRALKIFEGFPVPDLGYSQITMKWQDKEEIRRQLTNWKAQWPELKAKFQGQVYSFEKMKNYFELAGAPTDPSQIGCTRQMFHDMFQKVQLMRFRMNILDLGKRGGFYDQIVEPIFEKGGAWEIA